MRPNLGIAAWLPNDVEPGQAEQLIDDDAFLMQSKEDGRRAIVYGYEDGRVIGTNRNGEVLATPLRPEVVQAFADVPRPFALDCEDLHKGPIVLLDAIIVNNSDIRSLPCRARWDSLMATATRVKAPAVLVRTAFTSDQKIRLLDELRREFAEGAIWKRCDARYTSGRPAVGGSMLRWKFKKRCDVLLFRPTNDPDPRAHFYMFLHDNNGELQECGTVNAASFYSRIPADTPVVAEVEYLYSSPSNKMVQPVIVRLRQDKKPTDCLLSQLILGKKFRTA